MLLDLIGAENPQFLDLYPETSKLYSRLQEIGKIFASNTFPETMEIFGLFLSVFPQLFYKQPVLSR